MKMTALLIAGLLLLGGFGMVASAQSQGQGAGRPDAGPTTAPPNDNNVCPNPACPAGGMGRGYCGGRGAGGGMGRGAQMGGRGWRMGPQDGTGPRRDGSCIKS